MLGTASGDTDAATWYMLCTWEILRVGTRGAGLIRQQTNSPITFYLEWDLRKFLAGENFIRTFRIFIYVFILEAAVIGDTVEAWFWQYAWV